MHRFILSLAALLVLSGALFGYFFAVEKRFPNSLADLGQTLFTNMVHVPSQEEVKTQISSKVPQLSEIENVTLPEGDAGDQIKTLTERAGEISQHAQNVLGASIQKNDKEAVPIQESALEYGKYIYCKQVVNTYEATLNASSSAQE